ncbi:glycosyltransferase [Clostridium perfringens]|uniref:glycosyltransferase n=1 Tax=Clostridium perfringens TaxID=1502 RepID=UPI001CCBA2BD|nr:glycosyltransferase [Clostridium perfringens]UBK35295.1 glycosyltransferase [Clostridium perfringens]
MKKIKVSVIVPIYKVENYLSQCIDSILAQSYSNLEVILVDDGSPDSCPKICDNYQMYDSRIRVIHKENQGLGLARNTGLDIATGDYVLFVDSDDYIDIDMIKILLDKIIKNNSDTVFCGLNKVKQDGKIVKVPSIYKNNIFKGRSIINNILLEMVGSNPEDKEDSNIYMSVWHALYSMKIIKEHNIKFPSERIFMSEDISFHIDYLRYSKSATYIDNCLYYYRENENSLSKKFDENRFKRQKKLYFQILDKLSVFLEEDEYLLREQRRFLGGVRGRIIDIVLFGNENKIKKIRNVTEDDLVKNVLSKYPYHKNPNKHKIFNFLIKYRQNYLLYIVTSIYQLLFK